MLLIDIVALALTVLAIFAGLNMIISEREED